MIVASITAIAIIHLFGAAALCCGGEELCDGAAAIEDYGVIRGYWPSGTARLR